MARVTYGSGVTELSGSIGGTTYQRNSSGAIAKSKTKFPVNPSEAQSVYQANMSRIVSAWSTLSVAQISDWNSLASAHTHQSIWGGTKYLSGYQWFVSCALNRLLFESDIVLNAQPFISVPAPDQFTLEADSTGIYLRWSPAWSIPYSDNLVAVSPPLRQGNLNLRRSLFNLNLLPLSNISELDITSDYENAFNITWSDFYSASTAFIIARVRSLDDEGMYSSSYTSAILRIN